MENSGEWSFITPITKPLPSFDKDAMHCLLKEQSKDYRSMMCSAVALKGNAIAFVSQIGKVCVAPLKLIAGGIGTSDGDPLVLQRRLQVLERRDDAAVRFSEDGSRLIAIDIQGTLLIASRGSSSGRPPTR
jgi:hypothetical protein